MTDSLFGPFIPGAGGSPDCSDGTVGGVPSTNFSYIAKVSANDPDAPMKNPFSKPQCPPWYHSTAQIDQLQVNTSITGAGLINIAGAITSAGAITGASVQDTAGNILAVKKDFDIPHPTKGGWRLRHVCLEGPEAGVYIRGKCKGTTITCPQYWMGLVDPDTISVHLTPVGTYQELFVETIEWGKRIQIRNNLGGPIECFYTITGERKDGEKLISEYEGKSIKDYPGNNDEYSHNR